MLPKLPCHCYEPWPWLVKNPSMNKIGWDERGDPDRRGLRGEEEVRVLGERVRVRVRVS